MDTLGWDYPTAVVIISERESRLAHAEGKYDAHVLGCFVQSRPVSPSWINLDSIETWKYLRRPCTVHDADTSTFSHVSRHVTFDIPTILRTPSVTDNWHFKVRNLLIMAITVRLVDGNDFVEE
jgi:hypothetical protein